jgi:nicotinate-nucleotide adenylyltransferase
MTSEMPKKMGVLGGTFDPVHLGHLRAAEEALEALGLDRVLFIPAASPPHKSQKGIEDFEHRWELLKLAIADQPQFEASDLERRLPGKSYTVVTLRRLHEILPEGSQLFFLVGMDAFLELHTWWHYRELFELSNLVVLRRPGHEEEWIPEFLREHVSPLYVWNAESGAFVHPRMLPVSVVRNTYLGISSTRIRWLVGRGKSIRYLVPHEVLRYIAERRLYESPSRHRVR